MAINRTWRDWQDGDESQDSKPNTPGNDNAGSQPFTTKTSYTTPMGIPVPVSPLANMDMKIKPITTFEFGTPGGSNRFDSGMISFNEEHRSINSKMDTHDKRIKWELNRKSADPDFIIKHIKKQRLINAISTVFAKIAEDLTGEPIPGSDEWYMEDLLYRSCTHKPINKCKVDYEKERLVLVLDNSPSCRRQASFFSSVATAALKLNDVEIYAAPNARMTASMNPKTGRYEDLPIEDTCDYISNYADIHSMEFILGHWMRWRNRVVVFFGDHDGVEIICNASRHVRKLYWFNCTEAWGLEGYNVELYLKHSLGTGKTSRLDAKDAFVGKMYECEDENDFIDLIKKVRI